MMNRVAAVDVMRKIMCFLKMTACKYEPKKKESLQVAWQLLIVQIETFGKQYQKQ